MLEGNPGRDINILKDEERFTEVKREAAAAADGVGAVGVFSTGGCRAARVKDKTGFLNHGPRGHLI